MDVSILNKALKLIEEIYVESEYGDKDIFRIKDVIHSLDVNHWRNKQWAADIFYNLYEQVTQQTTGKILIIGGWYGLLAYQLRKRFDEGYHIISSDMDPKCAKLGYKLFSDNNIEFKTLALQNANENDYEGISAIFCTSVEHIPHNIIQDMINKKDKDCWVVLQSTNMPHKTHINPHSTYKDLEKSFRWPNDDNMFWSPDFANSQSNGEWNRHMVIAR